MRFIDLSHPLTHGQSTYPSDPPVIFKSHASSDNDGYALTTLSMGTHQGTHLDAPSHFLKRGQSVDRIPLDRFYGPATLVDLAGAMPLKAGAQITERMLSPHRRAFARGARIILRTAWERHWNKNAYFHDYPGLTIATARWIASRRIALLGLDTPGPSSDWLAVHRILLRAGIVIVENLCNLRKLPPRFTLAAFPLRLKGLDGSPVRAVAIVG